jgi:hypothetical protein
MQAWESKPINGCTEEPGGDPLQSGRLTRSGHRWRIHWPQVRRLRLFSGKAPESTTVASPHRLQYRLLLHGRNHFGIGGCPKSKIIIAETKAGKARKPEVLSKGAGENLFSTWFPSHYSVDKQGGITVRPRGTEDLRDSLSHWVSARGIAKGGGRLTRNVGAYRMSRASCGTSPGPTPHYHGPISPEMASRLQKLLFIGVRWGTHDFALYIARFVPRVRVSGPSVFRCKSSRLDFTTVNEGLALHRPVRGSVRAERTRLGSAPQFQLVTGGHCLKSRTPVVPLWTKPDNSRFGKLEGRSTLVAEGHGNRTHPGRY